MANLTKIILGLNILAAGAGIFFGITKSGKTGDLIDAVATAEAEKTKASGKVTKLENDRKDALDLASKAKSKVTGLGADKIAAEKAREDALTKVFGLENQNKTLEAEKQSWITERNNLQTKANEATIAQANLAKAEAALQLAEAELDKFKNPTEPEKPNTPTVTADGKVGKIANVDPRNGSIILNKGSSHGFKVGDQFNVFRNNKLVGRIEVTRLSAVNVGLSIAQRTEGLGVPVGAQFEVNDDLIKFQ